MANWQKVIAGLKKLVEDIGAFWPGGSTPVAGYAEDGPYHCEDCRFLRGKLEGKIFVDANGKGRCPHPVMLADPKVKKDADGKAIVNIQKGCCEFVDQIPHKKGEPEGLVQIAGLEGNDDMAKHGDFSHTVVTHHNDGTKTIHHIHRKHGHVHAVPEREGDVVGAVGDHDEMMDHMMDHTSEANEGEDQDAEQKPYPGPGAKA